jgi:hypothetical protein
MADGYAVPIQVEVVITRVDGTRLKDLAWFDPDVCAVVFPPSFPLLRQGDTVTFSVPPNAPGVLPL